MLRERTTVPLRRNSRCPRMTGRYKSAIDEAAAELARLSDTPSLRAMLFSPKSPNFCPEENRAAMFLGVEFNVLPEPNELFRQSLHYDVCIVDCHDNNEETVFMKFRSGNLAKLYFAWLWDNHHHPLHSFRTAMLADVVFVAHWRVRVSFNHPGVLPGAHMPACARQWSPALISRHYPKGLPVERSNALYGGYGHYDWAPERNALITRLRQRHPVSAVSSTDLNLYWRLPVEERLRSWVSHKVHLAIPIANDLSSRVFDALITGQIPLVPDSVTDLDLVVPPGAQAQLPILRYR